MLSEYERDLVNYWANWKPGMPPFGKSEKDYAKKRNYKPTQYEKDLVEYWKNWKPGMPSFGKSEEDYAEEKKKIKHTKKTKKEKPSSREIMEDIQFELGLSEEELDDLLIPEEEWDDLDEQ